MKLFNPGPDESIETPEGQLPFDDGLPAPDEDPTLFAAELPPADPEFEPIFQQEIGTEPPAPDAETLLLNETEPPAPDAETLLLNETELPAPDAETLLPNETELPPAEPGFEPEFIQEQSLPEPDLSLEGFDSIQESPLPEPIMEYSGPGDEQTLGFQSPPSEPEPLYVDQSFSRYEPNPDFAAQGQPQAAYQAYTQAPEPEQLYVQDFSQPYTQAPYQSYAEPEQQAYYESYQEQPQPSKQKKLKRKSRVGRAQRAAKNSSQPATGSRPSRDHLKYWMAATLSVLVVFAISTVAMLFVVLNGFSLTFASTGNVSAVGDSVEYNNIRYTLLDYYTTNESDFAYPYEGYEYLICTVEVVNLSDQPFIYDTSEIFRIEDENGTESVHDIWAISSNTGLDAGEIEPGVSVEGDIGFDIPVDIETAYFQIYDVSDGARNMITQFELTIPEITPYVPGNTTTTEDESTEDETTEDTTDENISTIVDDEETESEITDGDLSIDTDTTDTETETEEPDTDDTTITDTETEDTDITDNTQNTADSEVVEIDEAQKAPDNMIYTLESVEFSEESPSGSTASSGMEYLSCYIEIVNASVSDHENLPSYWTITDSSGNEIEVTVENGPGEFSGASLGDGGTASGYLLFEVPDTGSLTLNVYSDSTYTAKNLLLSWNIPR